MVAAAEVEAVQGLGDRSAVFSASADLMTRSTPPTSPIPMQSTKAAATGMMTVAEVGPVSVMPEEKPGQTALAVGAGLTSGVSEKGSRRATRSGIASPQPLPQQQPRPPQLFPPPPEPTRERRDKTVPARAWQPLITL